MAASSLAAMILIICSWFGGFMPGAQAAESAALERINFGFSAAGSVASAPLWMAQDIGAFKKCGAGRQADLPCRQLDACGGGGR